MSDSVEIQFPIQMTDAAANKVKSLITEEENPDQAAGLHHRRRLLGFSVRFLL